MSTSAADPRVALRAARAEHATQAAEPAVRSDPAQPGTLIIEAATAEAALAEVHTRLGADAEIVAADRALRGGIGGFFAREVVQLRARPAGMAAPSGSVRPPDLTDLTALRVADAAAGPGGGAAEDAGAAESAGPTARLAALRPAAPPQPAGSQPAEPQPAEGQTALDALLADLVARAGSEERSFADVLRGKMPELGGDGQGGAAGEDVTAPPAISGATRVVSGDPRAVTAAAPVIPAATAAATVAPTAAATVAPASSAPTALPVPTEPPIPPAEVGAPAGLPTPDAEAEIVDWSLGNLQRLGLPAGLLEGLRGLDPRDDTGWLAGLARAIGTLTRPLPAGPAAYVGPRAAKLAGALGVPVVKVGAEPAGGRPFAAAVRGSDTARSWLAWSRGRRWVHLVVGGEGWRPLLFDEPLAVSWVGEEDLCEAVRLAAELGLVLGYGMGSGRGAQARRATALEVALAIRDLLPRR
jgi:hypothetical protein